MAASLDSIWQSAHGKFGIDTALPEDLRRTVRALALRKRAASTGTVQQSTGAGKPLQTIEKPGTKSVRPSTKRRKKTVSKQFLFERLSPEDPNYDLLRSAFTKSWADSYGLVADGMAGLVSLSAFVESCVNTFDQGARIHIALKDNAPLSVRCHEIDRLTKKSIALIRRKITPETKRHGRRNVKAAIDEFSRRVAEIAARAKQSMLEAESKPENGESRSVSVEAASLERTPIPARHSGNEIPSMRKPDGETQGIQVAAHTNSPTRAAEVLMHLPGYPLDEHALSRLRDAIVAANARRARLAPATHGVMEFYAREALSPKEYQEHLQRDAHKREQAWAQFAGESLLLHVKAHLDSRRDQNAIRALFPSLYAGLIGRIFPFWLEDDWADRGPELSRFEAAVDKCINGSDDWKGFTTWLRRSSVDAPEPLLIGDFKKRCDDGHSESDGPVSDKESANEVSVGPDPAYEPESGGRQKGRKGGRPPKDQTAEIHSAWVQMGKLKVTAADCDKIAANFFADELNGVAPGTPKHKAIRERVRNSIRRAQRPAAT